MIRFRSLRFAMVLLPALAMLCACRAAGQTADEATQSAAGASQVVDPQPIEAQAQQSLPEAPEPRAAMAEDQLKQEENQRVLGVIPNFNSTNDPNAPPLTPNQKINIAFRSAIDPFAFVVAGLDAGHSQLENNFRRLRPGRAGIRQAICGGIRGQLQWHDAGNAYLSDRVSRGSAVLPQGHGEVKRRFFYAVGTSLWCGETTAAGGRTTQISWEIWRRADYPTSTIRRRTGARR